MTGRRGLEQQKGDGGQPRRSSGLLTHPLNAKLVGRRHEDTVGDLVRRCDRMRRSLVVLFAFVTSIPVQAQDCSQILSQGIYDIRSSSSDLATASSFSQWFCDKKFSSSQQANDFGASLGFPFKGVPVKLGFNASSQNWSEWYSSFCGRVSSDQSLQSRVSQHVQTVSPKIVQAFSACIDSDGLHVWIERTYDPKRFRFATRFNPPNENNPKATIYKFDPGPNVSCEDTPKTVSRPVWRTNCVRKNNNPVSMIVNSDWTPKGGGNLDLPSIASPPPPPPVPRCRPIGGALDFDGDGCPDDWSPSSSAISFRFGNGQAFEILPSPDYKAYNGIWLTGDFNGDRKTDLIQIVTSGVARPDYAHIFCDIQGANSYTLRDFNFRINANPQGDYCVSCGAWTVEDANGDGISDLRHSSNVPPYSTHRWISIQPSCGSFQIR